MHGTARLVSISTMSWENADTHSLLEVLHLLLAKDEVEDAPSSPLRLPRTNP